MSAAAFSQNPISRISEAYAACVRTIVYILIALSALGILSMMALTCLDVVLRFFGHPIKGSFDIIKILGAVSMSAALPYTTAIKGHVAIEYFFLKLSRRGRIIIDTMARSITIALFMFLSWQCVLYGNSLRAAGEGTPTLQLPVFWLPYLLAFCCGVTALVIVYNLVHPGREMIKP